MHFLIFPLLVLISNPVFTPSVQSLKPNPNFDCESALYGDARIANDGSVQLNHPIPSSSGLAVHTKPFRFIHSNPTTNAISFSSQFTFSFSVSPQNGHGLALVIVPADFPSNFNSSSFGILRDKRFLEIVFDSNCVRVGNVSKIDVGLNRRGKLLAWVDYHASLKRLDVRFCTLGEPRPDEPLISHTVDLGEMWKEEEVILGLTASSGDSVQTVNVYSWKNRVERVPKWMHSQPVNPQEITRDGRKTKNGEGVCNGKGACFFYGLIFGVSCGGLAALVLLFLYVMFVDRSTTVRDEHFHHPVEFRYEKIGVVVKDGLKDMKI